MRSLLKYRRPFVIGLHMALIVFANYLAFWLRFDGSIPQAEWRLFVQIIPWLIALRGVTFVPFRLYEGLWRYTSIRDLRDIILAVASSTILFFVLIHWVLRLTAYPRSVFLIDSLLLVFFMGGIRLTRRIVRELGKVEREKRLLIYGAGDAGELIVRDMRNNGFYQYEPIGFIDDNPTKVGQRIHGVKVLGTRDALPSIMEEQKPDTVLVAMPSSEPITIRQILKALEPYRVSIKTLPSIRDLLGDKVEVSQIRNLSIEDLLERTPVGLRPEPLQRLLKGKRVLVTGAGGSIGSELCRQIVTFDPSSLVLYERYENSLHALAVELTPRNGICSPVIGDVTDAKRLHNVMEGYRPDIIFHAAAHKHVPLMEVNPCEAVKNNILGTRMVAEGARRYKAERFILISTDKAVNPSSVMGVTKRVAELLVQGMDYDCETIFAAVRFGNVLGSNGSVVPLFLQQIKAGLPVTVTHPEMRRYFMLIPEAVQLVLHAAALAKGSEIFVLEMGEQIKVLDMARNLIRLMGFVPEEEIPIQLIGLRPGEKLFEELVGTDERVEPSSVENILRVQPCWQPSPEALAKQIEELEWLASLGDVEAVIRCLSEVVPSYRPYSSSPETTNELAQAHPGG